MTATGVAWVSLRDGEQVGDLRIEGVIAEATATSLDGELVAVGDDWTTPTGALHRPGWLDDISHLIIAAEDV